MHFLLLYSDNVVYSSCWRAGIFHLCFAVVIICIMLHWFLIRMARGQKKFLLSDTKLKGCAVMRVDKTIAQIICCNHRTCNFVYPIKYTIHRKKLICVIKETRKIKPLFIYELIKFLLHCHINNVSLRTLQLFLALHTNLCTVFNYVPTVIA